VSDEGQTAVDETIACLLSERELAERGDLLARELFPGDEAWTAKVLDFVAAERKCCPFFTCEVVFTPHGGPLWLRMRGSAGIKAFVRDRFHGADGLMPMA
jgi:hypothetical protein